MNHQIGNNKILIVDDDRDNVRSLEVFLQLRGFLVDTAENGEEALRKAKVNIPGIVISDLLMPKMDGYALCREWKADAVLRKVPFIAVTAAYQNKDDETFAVELGADRYLRKPIDSHQLIAVVEDFLSQPESEEKSEKPFLKDEKEIYKRHSERLQQKLEEKLKDLEEEIARRKVIEDELRKSKENLSAIIEASPDAIVVTDSDGIIIHTSAKTADLYGIDGVDELLGENVKDFIPAGEYKKLVVSKNQLSANGIVRDKEITLVKKNGETLLTEVSLAFLNNSSNGKQSIVGIARDVTARKNAEEKLRKSEEKYRTLFESMRQGVVYSDADGVISEVNNAALEIIGLSYEDTVGHAIGDLELDAILEDESPLPANEFPFSKALEEGRVVSNFVMAVYNPRKGKHVWLNVSAYPRFKERDPRPYQANILFNDITVQRELENQIHQSQKMETIGHLAAGIAHDFNNILAVILGSAELGLMAAEMIQIDPEIITSLQDVASAGKRAKGLIQQLLGFARKGKYNQQNLNINVIVKEVTYLLRRGLLSTIPISVRYDIGATQNIYADGTQMHQVIQNLAVNAKDALPTGGSITIKTDDISIENALPGPFGDIPKGSYVLLSVSDTGTGIDPVLLNKIFDPYFTTKEKGKGTGLGLSTVFGIVTNHNGYIRVITESGEGSTFEIYLPAGERVEEPEIPRRKETIHGLGKVLIVDDEEILKKIIATYLREHGYQVTEVSDTRCAVAEIGKGFYHVIVSDIIIDNQNGLEFIKEIKQRGFSGKILLMSGYHEDEKIQDALKNEADMFIQKPFTLESLGHAVSHLVSAVPNFPRV